MSIALLFITDGREDYAERTLASLSEMVPDVFSHRIVVDDSEHELGFAGAIQDGWDRVLATDAEYVFHLEDDFIFNAPVMLRSMQGLLAANARRKLAQVALKRQPWNEEEIEAGGIVECYPEDFRDERYYIDADPRCVRVPVTVHRRFFTTNPSLYPRAIAERGWPQEKHSEGVFTHQLLADGFHFAFWGGKSDPPAVEHIGRERAGVGY